MTLGVLGKLDLLSCSDYINEMFSEMKCAFTSKTLEPHITLYFLFAFIIIMEIFVNDNDKGGSKLLKNGVVSVHGYQLND